MSDIHHDDDPEGRATLEAIAGADKFNDWMYRTISAHCKGKTLEIGSGIGNISALFLRDKKDLVLSDLRHTYLDKLKIQFSKFDISDSIYRIDLVLPDFDTTYSEHLGKYDSVFALNVVEHIENDGLALTNIRKLLRPGGHAVILVPAYGFLFNRFDQSLGHFRRYTTDTMEDLQRKSGFKIIHKQYFNAAGIVGWFVSGNIMGKKIIPSGQMKLYNALVPIFKLVDRLFFNSLGLSAIVVGQKEEKG
jgi:SAM-dependent methyltransferase